jgi:Pyridoxamine 5'-phosphate oxidase
MAWLTTVRPDGRPDSVPAWFLLRDDQTILVCGQAAKMKLRSISHNPAAAPGLDVTEIGRDVIRIDGTAEHLLRFPQPTRYRSTWRSTPSASRPCSARRPVLRAVSRGPDHHATPPARLTAPPPSRSADPGRQLFWAVTCPVARSAISRLTADRGEHKLALAAAIPLADLLTGGQDGGGFAHGRWQVSLIHRTAANS